MKHKLTEDEPKRMDILNKRRASQLELLAADERICDNGIHLVACSPPKYYCNLQDFSRI